MTEVLFFGLVVVLVGFLFFCLRKATKKPLLGMGAITIWLLTTGVLSINGFFMKFDVLPPRIMLAIFLMILLLVYVAVSPKKKR